ncbi:MAG: CDP-glycerol glycerophosphotransferase [Actinomycetota bacterium]|jgi:glycosyltransferase involved in cell wall biosynthesis
MAAEPRPPQVSVIVPVRNRRALMRELLDALALQTFEDFEVVVVDDGSDDGTAEEAHADAASGRRVRVVQNEGEGAYVGRRTGVRTSAAPYIAFTDSDCVPDPGWLSAGVAALDAGADVVNGFTEPTRTPGPLERTMWSGEEGLYPTCNVFYRRVAYDGAGGFDVDAERTPLFLRPSEFEKRQGFGEDTRLGWRVRRAGRAVYEPKAVVRHQVLPPDLRDALRRAWFSRSFPALFNDVPELRSGPLCRHGVVLNTPGRYGVYLVAAALLTRRKGLVAAASGAWVLDRARRLRGPGPTRAQKLTALPVQLGLDVVSTTALLVGSARFRNVVL